MDIDVKKIAIFTVAAVLIAVLIWPRNVLKIHNVEDGNTIVLNNGATIKLLGVSSTEESKYELEQLKNQEIELTFDGETSYEVSSLDDNDVVYAYVLLPDYEFECINSTLLKQGKSDLIENCRDSLQAYRNIIARRGGTSPSITTIPARAIDYQSDEIILPDYQIPNDRKYDAWYTDGNLNLQMLEEACDFNTPYTKSFANQLAARSAGNFHPGQICEIFNYCYKKWRYVNDPNGREYVARASETIASYLTGDCDDFAILIASCLLAVGADVCINTGSNNNGGHAFTEVDIANFNQDEVLEAIKNHCEGYIIDKINTRQSGNHLWLNLDWQAAYPGGEYYDCSLRRDAYPCVNGQWSWEQLN